MIGINTFDYVFKRIFLQFDENKSLYSIAYFSKNIFLQNLTIKFMIKD